MKFRGAIRHTDGTKNVVEVEKASCWQEALQFLLDVPGIKTALVLIPSTQVANSESALLEDQVA